MERRQIQNTELSVSPFGLGTADAGVAWREEDTEKIFGTYLDLGGNVIDTAHVYSDWVPPETSRSERIIGDWLVKTKKRNEIVLVTKGGHPSMLGENPDMHKSRMRWEDMRKDLDSSLTKLRTDWIDLYFYHRDDPSIPVEETVEVMEDFVRQGKIRYYGCSNWTPERMKAADAYCKEKGYRGFVANQMLFNYGTKCMNPMADDTLCVMDDEMYAYHRENRDNLAMPYMGICSGFFHNYEKKGGDAVKESPYYTEGNRKAAGRLDMLKEKYGADTTQILLGFFTVQDFPCLPLYGTGKPERLRDAAKAFSIAFEKEDFVIK